jgi:hypothetical protein
MVNKHLEKPSMSLAIKKKKKKKTKNQNKTKAKKNYFVILFHSNQNEYHKKTDTNHFWQRYGNEEPLFIDAGSII